MEKKEKEALEETTEEDVQVETSKKDKIYINYTARVLIITCVFVIFMGLGLFLITKSFGVQKSEVVNYTETSDVDYKVYLKKNNFYDTEYLNRNMVYVASLIDNVNVDFNYKFNTDAKFDADIKYNVNAKLSIVDANGKTFFEKDYVLLEDKTVSMKDELEKQVKESIIVDYGYYNTIANNFKTSYGVNADSKLTVTMTINKVNPKDNDQFVINETDNMSVDIPLSEKAINITMNYNNINDQGSFVGKSKLSTDNIFKLVLGILFVVVGLYVLLRLVKLASKSFTGASTYDKYVAKLLKEYDRLIVETSTLTSFEDKEIIKVKDFNELLDVRDSLKVPIMYYVITKHIKSYFYIKHEDMIYLYTVKAVDLEENR